MSTTLALRDLRADERVTELGEAPPLEAVREAYAALNDRQARFCSEYLIDLNPKLSAIRCGYAPRSAGGMGRGLLRNARIIVVIQYLQARAIARCEVTLENVVAEIAKVAFVTMDDFMSEDESGQHKIDLTRAAARANGLTAVASIEQHVYLERDGEDDEGQPVFEPIKQMKLKLWDKTRGLDMLMRHLGGYNDSLDVNLGGGPLGAATRMREMDTVDACDAYMDMMTGEAPAETDRKLASAKTVSPAQNKV